MLEPIIIAAGIVVLILLLIWRLMRLGRNLRRSAAQLDKEWSDIERLIKQQNADVPRLLQTCRSYMPPDRPALKSLSEARASYQKANSAAEKKRAGSELKSALHKVFSEAGKYDGLSSSNTYIQLRTQLLESEERIAERCDLYNDDAARFNSRLNRFPDRLVKGNLKPRFH
ncbi:MAG: LemA family protein [Terriglobia bacterium]